MPIGRASLLRLAIALLYHPPVPHPPQSRWKMMTQNGCAPKSKPGVSVTAKVGKEMDTAGAEGRAEVKVACRRSETVRSRTQPYGAGDYEPI